MREWCLGSSSGKQGCGAAGQCGTASLLDYMLPAFLPVLTSSRPLSSPPGGAGCEEPGAGCRHQGGGEAAA